MITLDDLDVDNLIPLMPASVREEYIAHGDAAVFGFSPGVKHWLETSTHPRIERWRNDLKTFTALQLKRALERQQAMNAVAGEFYGDSRGIIRHRAVIDPVLKRHMEIINGRTVWHDPEAIADTERQAPKLFIKK